LAKSGGSLLLNATPDGFVNRTHRDLGVVLAGREVGELALGHAFDNFTSTVNHSLGSFLVPLDNQMGFFKNVTSVVDPLSVEQRLNSSLRWVPVEPCDPPSLEYDHGMEVVARIIGTLHFEKARWRRMGRVISALEDSYMSLGWQMTRTGGCAGHQLTLGQRQRLQDGFYRVLATIELSLDQMRQLGSGEIARLGPVRSPDFNLVPQSTFRRRRSLETCLPELWENLATSVRPVSGNYHSREVYQDGWKLGRKSVVLFPPAPFTPKICPPGEGIAMSLLEALPAGSVLSLAGVNVSMVTGTPLGLLKIGERKLQPGQAYGLRLVFPVGFSSRSLKEQECWLWVDALPVTAEPVVVVIDIPPHCYPHLLRKWHLVEMVAHTCGMNCWCEVHRKVTYTYSGYQFDT
jgi:hypothetical protein